MRILTFLVLFVGSFLFSQTSTLQAATLTGTVKTVSAEQIKTNKKAFTLLHREAKATHFLSKRGIDLQDPVNKWMWYWILGWGAGLVLSIIAAATITSGSISGFGIIWGLATLAYLFGTISLIVWLVKKFS